MCVGWTGCSCFAASSRRVTRYREQILCFRMWKVVEPHILCMRKQCIVLTARERTVKRQLKVAEELCPQFLVVIDLSLPANVKLRNRELV